MLCNRTGPQRRSVESAFRKIEDEPYDLGFSVVYKELLLFLLTADLGRPRLVTERHHSTRPKPFRSGAAQAPSRVEGGLDDIFLVLPGRHQLHQQPIMSVLKLLEDKA